MLFIHHAGSANTQRHTDVQTLRDTKLAVTECSKKV